MRIATLRRKPEKGEGAQTVDELSFIAGFGIVGDTNAGSPTRQVCLISSEASAAREHDGLCSRRFTPNIEIDDLGDGGLRPGTRLRADRLLVEIESVGKKCYAECPVLNRSGPCSLAKGSAFARVIEGGNLRVGQSIEEDE